ncbi:MAG: RpiB/LacA/LacB family sugar-phosphate isomerase [Chlorobium phaeobacteroides]|nr:RpiB/LacA/LacB family sugar-phosphate isomerase [Chlorobium phaeobacteroides]
MECQLVRIAIGSDHAGFRYKEKIKNHLTSLGYFVRDFGAHRLGRRKDAALVARCTGSEMVQHRRQPTHGEPGFQWRKT